MSILPGQYFILFGQHIWKFRESLNNILGVYHKHRTGYGNTPPGISYPHFVERERGNHSSKEGSWRDWLEELEKLEEYGGDCT